MSGSTAAILAENGLTRLQEKYNGNLGREDSLNLAIEAAEIHLKALRLVNDAEENKDLRKKTLSLFDEAERIKKGNDFPPNDRIYEMVFGVGSARRPTVAGPSGSVNASAPTAAKVIGVLKPLEAPVSSRPLSTREQKVLLESSLINGAVFPHWKAEDSLGSFELGRDGKQFVYAWISACSM